MIPAPLLDVIRHFEGCYLQAYQCPAGVWTIGYGATGPGIHAGLVWTQAEADARLMSDAETYARAVLRLSPILLESERRHAAIADFAFNCGLTAYKSSTLKKRVDAADWAGAAQELQRWVWGGGRRLPGLVRRRTAGAQLLIQGIPA